MRKVFRKLTTIALAAIMLLGTMTTALAEENKGNIVDSDKTGSITIHKYKMPDTENAFDSNTEAGGVELKESQLPTTAEPLANVQFHIVKMAQDQAGNWQETKVSYVVVTNESGEAVLEDLSLGRYKVEELGLVNSDGSDAVIPNTTDDAMVGKAFYVDVPMTEEDGHTLNYDVHVYPKNEMLSIDEYVASVGNKHASYNVKEAQTWIIQASIPGNIALKDSAGNYTAATTYEMVDELDSRLSYIAESLSVSVLNADGVELEVLTAEDYTFTEPQEEAGGTLRVSLSEKGKNKLKQAVNAAEKEKQAALLQVCFDTYINKDAAPATAIENYATLNFAGVSKNRTVTGDVTVAVAEGEYPEVHTGRIAVKKIAGDTQKPLSGVEFMIFDTPEKAKDAVKSLQENKAVDAKSALEVYDPNGGDYTKVVKTNGKGIADFTGLSYGEKQAVNEGETTYYIVETKTAAGYQLPSKYFEVTVNHDSSTAVDPSDTIINVKQSKLPAAGGRGTIIFTAVGLSVMAAAGIIILMSRKKKDR